MRFHPHMAVTCLLTTGSSVPALLAAQSPGVKPDRPECVAMAAAFTGLTGGQQFEQAAPNLTGCRDAWPRVLAAKWDDLLAPEQNSP